MLHRIPRVFGHWLLCGQHSVYDKSKSRETEGAIYQVAQGLGHFQCGQATHAKLALVGQEALMTIHQDCSHCIRCLHKMLHLYMALNPFAAAMQSFSQSSCVRGCSVHLQCGHGCILQHDSNTLLYVYANQLVAVQTCKVKGHAPAFKLKPPNG